VGDTVHRGPGQPPSLLSWFKDVPVAKQIEKRTKITAWVLSEYEFVVGNNLGRAGDWVGAVCLRTVQ
jgi:hypothetical protein